MTRSAPPTTCASNPEATLIDRIAHPTPIATPSGQTPTTARALRHRRHHLLPSRHVLGHRLLPRPDDRHPTGARLPLMLPRRRGQLDAQRTTPIPSRPSLRRYAANTPLLFQSHDATACAEIRGSAPDPRRV